MKTMMYILKKRINSTRHSCNKNSKKITVTRQEMKTGDCPRLSEMFEIEYEDLCYDRSRLLTRLPNDS